MGTIKRFQEWAEKLNWAFISKDIFNSIHHKYVFISPQGLVVELIVDNKLGNINSANNITTGETNI